MRNVERILQVTTELGVPVVQSEFGGRPELPEASEARFLDSFEELVPSFEAAGVELRLEPHPDDFVEDGFRAVDLVRGSSGLRYIVNPPGSTARVHQHLNAGEGEVDVDGIFAALGEVGFDGALCASVFAWEEKREESSRFMRRRIQELVDRW